MVWWEGIGRSYCLSEGPGGRAVNSEVRKGVNCMAVAI
jgi:hypothetical protein